MKDVDNEMELAVLGSMLRDRSIIPNVQSSISEADFYEPFNRELFRAVLTTECYSCSRYHGDLFEERVQETAKSGHVAATCTETVEK